jgi:hypothetical protein
MERKRPSKETLDNFVQTLIPYIIEILREDKHKAVTEQKEKDKRG